MFFARIASRAGGFQEKRLPALSRIFKVADGRLGKHESIRRFRCLECALDYDFACKSARETQNLAVAPILPEELPDADSPFLGVADGTRRAIGVITGEDGVAREVRRGRRERSPLEVRFDRARRFRDRGQRVLYAGGRRTATRFRVRAPRPDGARDRQAGQARVRGVAQGGRIRRRILAVRAEPQVLTARTRRRWRRC